ncbi:hypothetical protein HOO65_020675 [Ceratocystis lukuohia]
MSDLHHTHTHTHDRDLTVKRADSGYGSLYTSNPRRSCSLRRSSTAVSTKPASRCLLSSSSSSPRRSPPSSASKPASRSKPKSSTSTSPSASASPASSPNSTSSKRRPRCCKPHHRSSGCQLRSSYSHSMYRKPTPPSHASSFFHFPAPSLPDDPATASSANPVNNPYAGPGLRSASLGADPSYFHPPLHDHSHPHSLDSDAESLKRELPQTTQYWTSDHTRRLEYAAIDAASRGVRGWVMRNLVPDCLVPKHNKQHVAFDDDTGSVRRYRLDLDDVEESVASSSDKAKSPRKRSGVLSWIRR